MHSKSAVGLSLGSDSTRYDHWKLCVPHNYAACGMRNSQALPDKLDIAKKAHTYFLNCFGMWLMQSRGGA